MRTLDVGIVGCGTAGPAAALFLARRGHRVTLYERVEAPMPIGAGIILQPTGQHVLRRLGLLDEVASRGERLDALRVVRANGGRLLDLEYRDVDAAFSGVGLHRGVLFDALYRAVVADERIRLRLGLSAEGLARAGRGRAFVRDANGVDHGPHDLIVAADGARSRLRDDTGLSRSSEPYPWGALWFVARDPDRVFRERLYQVVDGTRRMLGLLPTGLGPRSHGSTPLVSVYWSIPGRDVDAWRQTGFDDWKRTLHALAPEAGFVFDQIRSPSDVLFSAYHDVVMQRWNVHNVVHLGDAAHAMSPQLGQGANLALWDAMVLADCLEELDGEPLVRALDAYSLRRRHHLGYFQWVTRALTPFFQSDHDALGWMRDAFMPIAGRVPLFRRAMVMGMCGTADGHPWRSVAFD